MVHFELRLLNVSNNIAWFYALLLSISIALIWFDSHFEWTIYHNHADQIFFHRSKMKIWKKPTMLRNWARKKKKNLFGFCYVRMQFWVHFFNFLQFYNFYLMLLRLACLAKINHIAKNWKNSFKNVIHTKLRTKLMWKLVSWLQRTAQFFLRMMLEPSE